MADSLSEHMAGLALSEGGSQADAASQPAAATAGGTATLSPGPPRAEVRVAGAGEALSALREVIGWPVVYAEQAAALGLSWPRGLMLHGPPGCGKSLMVQAVAGVCSLSWGEGGLLLLCTSNQYMKPEARQPKLTQCKFTQPKFPHINAYNPNSHSPIYTACTL